ncbi:MAG: hypothetical protein U5K54_19095 [Cytophagales bacterium]|nr:hypothetical protein [Cytophagales bacterium]
MVSATDGIVVTIFDKERNKVATSKINGQFITAIAYRCNARASTIFNTRLMNPPVHCGGSALRL